MSAALRGAKKFRVTTSLVGMFKAVGVSVCNVAFFEVPVVSSVARLFRLRTSWKSFSLLVCYPVVFGMLVLSARVLALFMAFISCNVTV
jgi:hypothetical protein